MFAYKRFMRERRGCTARPARGGEVNEVIAARVSGRGGNHHGGERPARDGPRLGSLQTQVRDPGGLERLRAWILTSDHGMTTWSLTLLPDVYAAITAAGYKPEFVTPGNSPSPT